jgi:hypothetical protein
LLPTATNKQQPWTPRGEEEEEDDQEVFMDETADTQPDPARTRMGSKRMRDELPDEEGEEETTEPPAKH